MKLLILLCSLVLICQGSLFDKDPFAKGGNDTPNPEFENDASTGKADEKTFDTFSPAEIRVKIRKLFHRVNDDADNFVTEDELKKWIQHIQNQYLKRDYDKQMKQNDLDKDGYVTWEEYTKATSQFLDESDGEKTDYHDGMLLRDEKRFKLADKEGDMKLELDEFSAFLHPENHAHMKGMVVNETLEDIDKDKDGFISLEEYIGDLFPEEDRDGEEPAWVKAERVQFNELRDKNKDGRLDPEEIKDWILPAEKDNVISEAKHLVSESDTDGDGKISKEEMVEKYDLFVGSQATDFGEILKSNQKETTVEIMSKHEEL